jgi:hypothetical protein
MQQCLTHKHRGDEGDAFRDSGHEADLMALGRSILRQAQEDRDRPNWVDERPQGH